MRAVMLLVLVAACSAGDPPELTPHLLYVHDCRTSACTVRPGADDARADRSSLVDRERTLEPALPDDASYRALVTCVETLYAPFPLTITTSDPGDADHVELMLGGLPRDVGLSSGGGVAPPVCAGDGRRGIAFVFAGQADDPARLCWAATQEVGHLFGLDHVLDPYDPMTYLWPPVVKHAFQDHASSCGETAARPCRCTGAATQNSFAQLFATLAAT